MTMHAKYSPSGAPIWNKCTASMKYPKEESKNKSFAEEGTTAHKVLEKKLLIEKLLKTGVHIEELKAHYKELDDSKYIKEEMYDYAEDFINYIKKIRNKLKDYQELSEYKVSHPEIENFFGTCDYIIYNDKEMHIVDYKYGVRIKVDVTDNDQIKIYAYLALKSLTIDKKIDIYLHIFQPRNFHFDINNCSIKCDYDELIAYGKEVEKNIKDIEVQNYKYNPGDKQCRFCHAKSKCDEYRKFIINKD